MQAHQRRCDRVAAARDSAPARLQDTAPVRQDASRNRVITPVLLAGALGPRTGEATAETVGRPSAPPGAEHVVLARPTRTAAPERVDRRTVAGNTTSWRDSPPISQARGAPPPPDPKREVPREIEEVRWPAELQGDQRAHRHRPPSDTKRQVSISRGRHRERRLPRARTEEGPWLDRSCGHPSSRARAR